MAQGENNERPSVEDLLAGLRSALAATLIDELEFRHGDCVVSNDKQGTHGNAASQASCIVLFLVKLLQHFGVGCISTLSSGGCV